MFKLKSIKTQLILFLMIFALYLFIKDNDFSFLSATLVAVVGALIVESMIIYFKTKKFTVTESSIITGFIVGYVLSADEAWWVFAVSSAVAIGSKYLIRFRKKHIFNPSAFGILSVIMLFGVSTQWKGTYAWYALIPWGLYAAYRIRKLEILTGYAAVALILFGFQAFLQGGGLWHIFGYFSYFLISIMIIEPKTAPITPAGKYLFGAGISALIFIFTELGTSYDVELMSLLIMNAAILLFGRKHILKKEVVQ
ncbi:MAG: RnfABCDGE type electron transport complex subunit D [bacterium]